MYQLIDDTLTITVNDWERAGLSRNQFENDSKRGYLKIVSRGIKGATRIAVDSILRPERMACIERALGKADDYRAEPKQKRIYSIEIDLEARAYYTQQAELIAARIPEYTAKASMFKAMQDGYRRQVEARASGGKKLHKKEFYARRMAWWNERCEAYCVAPYTNARSLERAFKEYCNGGYAALIHKGIGSDNARVVSRELENLLLSLWRTNDKPFVKRVHQLYMEFVSGTRELFDTETGEIYSPSDFIKDGKAPDISLATVWRYLKDVINTTAVYADRNGNFDYVNKMRPKHHRHAGEYSLSKISMDDVALSRKSVNGWVYKYIAVDVVSGYYFRPAYIVGKPTIKTVMESFRNIFCELVELGLPMPGELEVEHHLMKDIAWLGDVFAFTRFCNSPTEKRAEHNIKSLKWSTAKYAGHTRGRWYAKHEAWRCVRNKVDGDMIDPVYQPQRIVADDLADIDKHNNTLHPLQKTYPGMTRRDVFIKHVNPNLKAIDNAYLYKYIGNETKSSIRNNDYCVVNNAEYEITDFAILEKLKPNSNSVVAYWLPDATGDADRVYLYQDGVYIGEAENRANHSYNECAIERTDKDRENMLHQNKRNAMFDKYIKGRKKELVKVGSMEVTQGTTTEIEDVDSYIVDDIEIGVQPEGYEEDEFSFDFNDIANNAKQAI